MANKNMASSFQMVAAETATINVTTASMIRALRFRVIAAGADVMLAFQVRWTTFISSRWHSQHSKVRRS
jgi:hypothetical protein